MRYGSFSSFVLPSVFVVCGVSADAAIAAGTDGLERRCIDSAHDILDSERASAVCGGATADTIGCIDAAYSHGLRGDEIVTTCHEAAPTTVDCIETTWLDGLRRQEIVIVCQDRPARRTTAPFDEVYLNRSTGAETAELPACGGHIDLSEDTLGRVQVAFSVVTACSTFEVWDANGIRRFSPKIPVGSGPMRRTGSWQVPDRIVNVAERGLKVVMRTDERKIRDVVYIGFVSHGDAQPAGLGI